MEPARGSAATTVIGRLRQWLAGWGLKEWRRAGLVAVLVATAAFGGLDTVNKQVTDLTVGEPFDTGRFEMTVERATLVSEVRAGERRLFTEKPGRRYLGLVMRVRNYGSIPGRVDNPVQIVGVPDMFSVGSVRTADGTITVSLGPGLADELVLLYDVPETALSVGSDVRIRISKEVRKLSATVGQGWVPDRSSYAQLGVPVGGPR